jgi:hypothetical protein
MTTRAGSIDGGRPRNHGDHLAARWVRGALTGLVAAACACGGPAQEPANPDDMAARLHQPHAVRADAGNGGSAMAPVGDPGEPGEPGEAGMSPALAKFHDTMAPRWHAEHGAKRKADTCAAIGALRSDADAVAGSATPSGADPVAWQAGGKQLALAVAALETACKAGDDAAFEQAFKTVHQRFHALMETGGEHEP